MSELITGDTALRTIGEIEKDLCTHKLRAAKNLIAIGQDLRDAKAQLQHGQWLDFLGRNGFSARSAQNYMRLSEAADADPKVAALPYSKALALISAPDEVREQLRDADLDSKSAAEIRRLSKELDEEIRLRKSAEQAADAAIRQTAEAEDLRKAAEHREKEGWHQAYQTADRLEKSEQIIKSMKLDLDQYNDTISKLAGQIKKMQEHPATVEKVVEKVPDDYEDLKTRLREAEEAAAQAEEQAEAAMAAAEAEDGPRDVLSAQDALSAANQFVIQCWCLPHMGAAFAAMDERERQSFRVILGSVVSLCEQALQTMERSRMIEGAV